MRKIALIASFIMMLAISAEAQERRGGFGGPGGPGGFQERMIEMMKENIPDLTQVQTDSISAFMKRQNEEMMKNMPKPGEGQNFDREKMRENMEKRQKAQDEKFKTILTEEQYKAYKEWQEEMRSFRPMGR